MADRTDRIERFQLELFNRNVEKLRQHLDISNALAEVMLWGFEHLPSQFQGNADGDPVTALKTVFVRMYNDFEVAKLCAFRGLPDQSYGPLRDTIECMMLLRLFTVSTDVAARWITHANEYTPGVVNAQLREKGIVAVEYSWYGMLSDLAHPNLAGSLGTLTETDHGDGSITIEWGVGGYDNQRLIKLSLKMKHMLQLLAIVEPLTKVLAMHLGDDLHDWLVMRSTAVRAVGELVDGETIDREDIDPGGAAIAISRMEGRMARTTGQMLATMQTIDPDFSFD